MDNQNKATELFNFKGHEVRTITTFIDGMVKVYFVANDVAKALGFVDTINAVKQHTKGVVKHHVPTKGGTQLLNTIPESDVYRLALRSRLPSAEEFQDWVCEEVLPSIRRDNMYLGDLSEFTVEEQEHLVESVKELKANLREKTVEAHEKTDGTYSVTQLARQLTAMVGFFVPPQAMNLLITDSGLQITHHTTDARFTHPTTMVSYELTELGRPYAKKVSGGSKYDRFEWRSGVLEFLKGYTEDQVTTMLDNQRKGLHIPTVSI